MLAVVRGRPKRFTLLLKRAYEAELKITSLRIPEEIRSRPADDVERFLPNARTAKPVCPSVLPISSDHSSRASWTLWNQKSGRNGRSESALQGCEEIEVFHR
jgi:hypothetical protein